MTKKELQRQIDELRKRLEEVENRPQFSYLPPIPNTPYVPPVCPTFIGDPVGPVGSTTVCANNSEATHQEYFGVK